MIGAKHYTYIRLKNALILSLFFFTAIWHQSALSFQVINDPTSLKVWSINFKGNKSYNSIVLKEVIASEGMSYIERWFNTGAEGYEFSESEVQKDVIRLERFYRRRGFSDVSVSVEITEGKKWWQRNLRFIINEGEPIKIRSLSFNIQDAPDNDILTNKNFVKQANKQPLRVGKRYEPIRLQEVSGSFVSSLRDMGFPYAEVKIDALVDSLHKKADLTIHIQTGPSAHIDSIQVIGNKSVSANYILREANLYKGLSFSQRRLGIAQQELFNHHLFRFVTVSIPDQNKDSTVSLVVRVRENPLRVILIRGGVGTEEIVRGEASWTHLNPFGNAHSITFKARTALNADAEVRQARVAFDYNVPYVFNTKSGTQTSPFVEYRNEYSFKLTRYGINNAFIYQHSLEWQSSIAHEYTINRIGEKTTRSINRDSLKLYNISAIQIGALYRQGFIERDIGWYIAPIIELSGFLRTGTYQYEKLFLDLRRYIRLSKTMQLALKTHTGLINAKRSDDLPAAVRLYAGGTTSVRGWLIDDLGPKRVRFNDDGTFDRFVPTGGKVLFSFSAEVRKKVDFPFRGLGFATFIDGGQIWRNVSDVTILVNLMPQFAILPGDVYTGLQYGFGGGMSYDSPIGPIRVDIAYKINPTEADLGIYQGVSYGGGIRRWGIHFSIGHPF